VSTSFGGTSGATPMVAGSAALLLQAHPGYSPLDVKAALMNTADTDIFINPATQPGVLAPITRIGGGEVRVNDASASKAAAWDFVDRTPSLSFGYEAVLGLGLDLKLVEVRNRTRKKQTLSITPSFRYSADATGAVTLHTQSSVTVPPNGSVKFPVLLKVDGARLPVWTLNGGARGGDGFRLQEVEFDGLLTLSDGQNDIHLPWHVLPHRAAAVLAFPPLAFLREGSASITIKHFGGTIDARVDPFSLLGTSDRIPRSELPGPGDNFAVVDLRFVGARLANSSAGPVIQFGINTFGKRSHPNYPAEFDILVDNNRDGTADFIIFNLENGGFGVTGQNVVAVVNAVTGAGSIFFFTDADLNSANAILTAPLGALGLTPTTTFDFSVLAIDNYFTGNVTDMIEGITYTPAVPRYVASGIPATGVPVNGKTVVTIGEVSGGAAASRSQSGILLLYRDAPPLREADAIRVH
jgi:hypothetical protein